MIEFLMMNVELEISTMMWSFLLGMAQIALALGMLFYLIHDKWMK